jgi:phospholipid/cholesterol/gamma-HCH transport system permease protein
MYLSIEEWRVARQELVPPREVMLFMSKGTHFFSSIGEMSAFGTKALVRAFVPPYETVSLMQQLTEIGARSVPLVAAAGLALGIVMTLHTRSTLVSFGAEAWAPTLQAVSFFNELGPLITALLISGRVGAGIGAELANMRANEQIDAIEAMSVDSSKLLVSTRILACIITLPLLTIFMDFAGLLGGFISEYFASHTPVQLYINRAFVDLSWASFIAPTLKTCVFGFIIGTVSCFFGYTINEGSAGVRRAATSSVVLSSLLVILADVPLVKLIYFFFPGSAL